MKINIVGGSGIMGKVHKPVFEREGCEVVFSGRNSNPGIEEATRNSDLTIVSVPISYTSEVIRKVAPHSRAIMDFTGLKEFPINEMLEHSSIDCEVGGMHPLYGDVNSLEDKSVIYCPTERSGAKCERIIFCLQKAGAKVVRMNPRNHDLKVSALLQNLRIKVISAYLSTLQRYGLNAQESYDISSPPTRAILDLASRQLDEKNDRLCEDMLGRNFFTRAVEEEFINQMYRLDGNYKVNARALREEFLQRFIDEGKEKAEKIINFA